LNVIVMGGMGQVGKALVKMLDKNETRAYILDKKGGFYPSEILEYEFMHVTIPYTDYFFEAVRNAISKYNPRYVVVHSTVPVGTTRRIGSFAAHTPVRGQHNNLEDGMKRFVKYVGAHNPKTLNAVGTHLINSGFLIELWRKPEETELMKMLCLTRYLSDLSFYEVGFKACRRFGVAPSRLLQWTNTYNDGYRGTKWQRPELTFPRGKVGGHCVLPVSKMLANQVQYGWLKKNIQLFENACQENACALKNSNGTF